MLSRLYILITGLAIFFFLGSAKPTFFPEDTILIINKIKIEITGASTIGKYNCSNTFTTKDTVYVNSSKKNTFNTEIKMSNFDCGNKIMTKDLQGTVKVKQFPNSSVSITDVKPYGKNYICRLSFFITDKTLKYKDFVLYKTDDKIQGTLGLKFSDIALEPPVKMAGLIKVKDDIVINFSLYKN
ncbi:hypothetical protein [Flavobacterium daemonense]|uniref:hypothetical protein n=1 Tax=Flavobacterium daemonense TaxID=1393049 RepID=UPI001184841F|nr:hypothetical protein [Flavobacterium daemonense]KAF2327248.1 hypothetical protein FND99_19425 [Flavobacterium daemonense]